MSFDVKFEIRDNYLYAHVTGANSVETVRNYMQVILEKCESIDCFRVLINECLEGPRLRAIELFEVASEGSLRMLGKFDAIAFVDEQMGDNAEFVETVAVNRGMPLAMFKDLDSAESWIREQTDDSDSQRIFRGNST